MAIHEQYFDRRHWEGYTWDEFIIAAKAASVALITTIMNMNSSGGLNFFVHPQEAIDYWAQYDEGGDK